MRIFITSKIKYLSNDMNIFGTWFIPLNNQIRGGEMVVAQVSVGKVHVARGVRAYW